MSGNTILSSSVAGNECNQCEKLYTSKDPLRHLHPIQGRENVQVSSLSNKTARKDNLISHQKAHTSELALNRKHNASEAQLSAKIINLPLETQHSTNLK